MKSGVHVRPESVFIFAGIRSFLASYEFKRHGEPDAIEFGPLFEKQLRRVKQRLNLIWEKQVGSNASGKYEFRAAYSLSYKWRDLLQPGFETYIRPSDKAYQIGPVIRGELASRNGSELEYSVGVLLGVNRDAPDQTLLLRLEYEFF